MTLVHDPAVLADLGLRHGEAVRFRRVDHRRWELGKITGIRPDGSVLLHDGDGAARSVRPENLEVRRAGPRGRLIWRNVAEVAITWERLELWD